MLFLASRHCFARGHLNPAKQMMGSRDRTTRKDATRLLGTFKVIFLALFKNCLVGCCKTSSSQRVECLTQPCRYARARAHRHTPPPPAKQHPPQPRPGLLGQEINHRQVDEHAQKLSGAGVEETAEAGGPAVLRASADTADLKRSTGLSPASAALSAQSRPFGVSTLIR